MPVISTIGAAAARAYGLFRSLVSGAAGYLYMWGSNTYGQIGQNNIQTTVVDSPVQIGSDANITDPVIAGHRYGGYAVKGTGTLWAWGRNAFGEGIPDGTTVDRSSPVQIGTLNTWRKVAGAVRGGYAVQSNGTLWTWGYNSHGQLGINTITNPTSSPVQVGTLTNWSNVFQARFARFAIKTDGTLWAWGLNSTGILGDGTTVARSSPVQIGTQTNWYKLSAFPDSVAAIKTDGTLWTWGSGAAGALGQGDIVSRSSPVQVGTLSNWADVSAISGNGTFHAVKTDGTLWAWGDNGFGWIGDATTTNKSSPIQVGALTNWAKVGSGSAVAVAIKTDGTLWAWGYGNDGRIGDGTTISRSSPVQIGYQRYWKNSTGAIDDGGVIFVSTDNGEVHTFGYNEEGNFGNNTTVSRSSPVQVGNVAGGFYLNYWPVINRGLGSLIMYAVRHDNTLWAWGNNFYGVLGDGTVVTKSSPVQIGSGTDWLSVASEFNSSAYFLKTNGTLWSVGRNNEGQLGHSDTVNRSSPVQVGGLTTWRYVSTGRGMVMATKSDGTLWAWGRNDDGDLGTNNNIPRSSPVQVGALTDWEKPAKSNYFVNGAIKKNGTIWTWCNNGDGALGNNSTVRRSSPVQIGADAWADFALGAGYATAVAIKSDGTLWGWGRNTLGQVGDSTTINRSSPVQINASTNWMSLSAGDSSGFAINKSKQLYWWGSRSSGNSAGASSVNKSSPVQIGTLTNWAIVNAGSGFSNQAAKTDGSMWSWGDNSAGALGQNVDSFNLYPTPTKVGTSNTWSQVVVTTLGYTVGALQSDGKMFWWGYNGDGMIGDGTLVSRSSPIQIGAAEWAYIGQAQETSAAVKTNGTLWTWARNDLGTMGDGTTVNKSSPVQIGTLTNWETVAGGYYCFFATKTDGTLWSWGFNSDGQLGIDISDAVLSGRSSPVQIGTLTTWSEVSAGEYTGFALKNDGTLWGWGRNANGELGTNNLIGRSSPVQIASGVKAFSASRRGGAYVATNGTLWAWGQNNVGQVGDNSTVNKSSPVQIGTLTTWDTISGGYYTFYAKKTDGTLWSWGYNGNGEAGDGTYIDRSSPVQIGTLTSWIGRAGGSNLSSIGGWGGAISTT